MSKDFFVILTHPNGQNMAMVENDDGDLAMFDTEDDAAEAAKNNPLGEFFGYEIFEIGRGESCG